jgi:HTH-type transcriptional regulator/antitoxin HigA
MKIQSELEYESALHRVDQLWDADPSTSEGEERDALFLAVKAYEATHYPIGEPESQAAIEFHLDRLGLSIDELPISQSEKELLKSCVSQEVLVPEWLAVKMSPILGVPRDVLGYADVENSFQQSDRENRRSVARVHAYEIKGSSD